MLHLSTTDNYPEFPTRCFCATAWVQLPSISMTAQRNSRAIKGEQERKHRWPCLRGGWKQKWKEKWRGKLWWTKSWMRSLCTFLRVLRPKQLLEASWRAASSSWWWPLVANQNHCCGDWASRRGSRVSASPWSHRQDHRDPPTDSHRTHTGQRLEGGERGGEVRKTKGWNGGEHRKRRGEKEK